MHGAALSGQLEVVRALLEAGADKDKANYVPEVWVVNKTSTRAIGVFWVKSFKGRLKTSRFLRSVSGLGSLFGVGPLW